MSDKSDKKQSTIAPRRNAKVIERAVSGKLKAYYDEMTRQEVPDRFLELLRQLDESPKRDE
jgi:anti-sigma factor NepR-like protein